MGFPEKSWTLYITDELPRLHGKTATLPIYEKWEI